MKNILLILFIFINISFSSTFEQLNITDNDFLKIMHSDNRRGILNRINNLIILKESLKDENNIFTKIQIVNSFFNKYSYLTDEQLYKKNDYWATRKEFIINGGGDCEDFVVAKYFTLLELGIDESKLSILHGIYKSQYHVVLAYQDSVNSDVYILDSSTNKILLLTEKDDFLILYTLNTIDLKNNGVVSTDLQYINNYKWTEVYLKSKKLVN